MRPAIPIPNIAVVFLISLIGFSCGKKQEAAYGPREFGSAPLNAIVAAYQPEIEAILKEIANRDDTAIKESISIKGVTYHLGTFEDEPIVVFVTGVSVANAAMTMQMAFDYFPIKQVLYLGIAGAVNPELHPGDVTVPARWYYHDESNYANPDKHGGFVLADYYQAQLDKHKRRDTTTGEYPRYENFGMIHPDEVAVVKEGWDHPRDMPYFEATSELLEASRRAAESMPRLLVDEHREVRYLIGGNGVTGSVFMDNAEYRIWTRRVWNAEVTEMESAAVGQVCFINDIPWVIVRAVSDLAGGQEGKNVENIYDDKASEHATKFLFQLMAEL